VALFGPPPSLTELIGRAIAEDEKAQWTLFEMYESQIYGYIRHQFETNRCVQPPEDSLEVANWVWFKALDPEKLKRLENPDAFPSWLYKIAKNDSIAHLRRCTKNPTVELEDYDCYEPVTRTHAIEESIEASERIQQSLIRARSIDERLPEILVLTLKGNTAKEIGEQLGISSSNVRVIRRRGLIKLNAMLKRTKE
jgi:RNA polymerase sigma factor (sigma-70 family)